MKEFKDMTKDELLEACNQYERQYDLALEIITLYGKEQNQLRTILDHNDFIERFADLHSGNSYSLIQCYVKKREERV